MKKIVWIVLFYVALAHPALAQPAELNGKIRFVWGDEFNGTTIDTNIWNVRDNFDNYSDGDGAVALKKNVWISGNGLLNCRVLKETYYCPASKVSEWDCKWQWKTNGAPYSYTYGRIDAKEKYNQQYGYAEALLYFSPQPGLWPAFWTTPGDGVRHTNAGEVDIMERSADADNNTVTTNVHLDYCPENTGTSCPHDLGKYCTSVPTCYGKQHHLTNPVWNATKYALYWSPTELVFYINDDTVRTMPNPGVIDPLKFILGMGVSSDKVTPQSILPSIFYVDYIHVYELYECLHNAILPTGYTFVNNNGTQSILAACTTIEGNGTTGGKMTMVATNSIAILPNYVVKQGGYLEARISSTGREIVTEEPPKPESYYQSLQTQRHSNANTNTIVASEQSATEELFTVSPNPIVYTGFINYSIAKQGAVKITLYNIMGIVQGELVNENQLAGEHTYELDATAYKAGIYLLVFESGGTTQKRTVVITK
jgi:beta-glucanase (GH16 family)